MRVAMEVSNVWRALASGTKRLHIATSLPAESHKLTAHGH